MVTKVTRSRVVVGLALAATLVLGAAAGSVWAGSPKEEATTPGNAALHRAATNHKYLFICFWREDTQQSRTMQSVFRTAMAKMTDIADSFEIQVNDTAEQELVKRYGVGRSPMPLVLAIAPNGAIVKGLPGKFDEKQLRQAFVSPCTAECMKALQAGKLVLVCVEPASPRVKRVSLQEGVQAFKADEDYTDNTAIVTIDARDKAEAAFLKDIQVDPKTAEQVTVLLAPPAGVVGAFVGSVTKDQIVEKLKAAQSGGCPGGKCGPGGCGPKK